MSEFDERQIEMTWRCSACANVNRGRHMACEKCGDPKDEREVYEMPSDVAAAATVTDPALLRMAHAAANWRCAYCGSDQRAIGGGCARCGAGRQSGANAHPTDEVVATPARRASSRSPRGTVAMIIGIGAVALLSLTLFAAIAPSRREQPLRAVAMPSIEPTVIVAQVTSVAWTQTVHLDRWSLLDGEGFAEARPSDAIDVKQLATRVHHHEQVLDHYDSEPYTVQEPDGFDTQTYSEHVSCGQDCTSTPQTCTQQCTPNKNGFATCRQVCSGGGQHCTTKYCDQPRTRQVPRTKSVTKTRQVPRFRDEARMAPWFGWHVWGWKEARVETANGTTIDTRWPALLSNEDAGIKERERREALYRIAMIDYAGRPRDATIADPDLFATMVPGSWHSVRIVDVQGTAVQITDSQ